MNEDCLKLTVYFGERDRTARGLLADELLELFGERRVEASVLLRGAEGFGRRQHVRTDRLLSLSEDLPAVAVAVDRRAHVESLLDEVLAMRRRGLITLERAQLLTGHSADLRLPEKLRQDAKLTVYLGRRQRALGSPPFAAVCDLLHRNGIAGATALLGVDGTRHGTRARARFLGRNLRVPMMIVAVGAGERIERVIPQLGEQLDEPVMTVERVRVCKRDGELLAAAHELPSTDEHGLPVWQKLTVYCSQAATHAGRPLSAEIVRRLRAADAAGATSLRAVWGFHGDHPPHGDRLLQLRRRVPVCTIAVDSPERSVHAFAIIDELTTEHGLVTSEMVPALSTASDDERGGGFRLASHDY